VVVGESIMGKWQNMANRIAKLASIKPQLQMVESNFSPMYNEGVTVIAQPPTRRIVQINMEYRGEEGEEPGYNGNFFLSFPLMYFRIQYKRYFEKNKEQFSASSLHVIFAVADNKSKAFIPPLPNVDDLMRVCIELPKKRFSNVDDLYKAAIDCFWSTDFNDGMTIALYQYDCDSLLGNHRKWQNKTKKQPIWIPNGRSLKPIENFDKKFFYGSSFKKDIQPEDEYDSVQERWQRAGADESHHRTKVTADLQPRVVPSVLSVVNLVYNQQKSW